MNSPNFKMFLKKVMRFIVVMLGVVASVLFFERETALAKEPSRSDLASVAKNLQQVVDINLLLETCPADIMGTRRTWAHWLFFKDKGWKSRKCKSKLEACTTACTKALNRSACFAIARILENHELPKYDKATRQAFALACALGSASGCTNRGGAIRNAKSPIDPLSNYQKQAKERCLMRTFTVACAGGSAWGCAMEGQAHRLGEGGPVNFAKARAQYFRACSLSSKPEKKQSERAPCRFARQQMKDLNVKQ